MAVIQYREIGTILEWTQNENICTLNGIYEAITPLSRNLCRSLAG